MKTIRIELSERNQLQRNQQNFTWITIID